MASGHDIHHIADLARITLTPQEEERFQRELLGILEFITTLDETDTSAVEPLSGGTITTNRMRADAPSDPPHREKNHALITAAPEKKEGWIKVKSVFA